MRPGDIIYPLIQVTDTGGTPVTGKVTGDFVIKQYINATAEAGAVFTVTEISGGFYRIALTSAGAAGWQSYRISEGSDICTPFILEGDLTEQDEDSLFGLVIRPTVALADTNQLGSTLNLEIVANRFTTFTVSVTDQAGAPIDFSGTGENWNNVRFNVWDKLHTASVYALTGITAPADGVFTWDVPENAAFFSSMATQIAAGNDSITLYYDLIGDFNSDTAKTKTILRGQLTMYRFEGSA